MGAAPPLLMRWPGTCQQRSCLRNDLLLELGAVHSPVGGPVLPLTDPADERLETVWVAEFVPPFEPDDPSADFWADTTFNDFAAKPSDELPPALDRLGRCEVEFTGHGPKQFLRLGFFCTGQSGQGGQGWRVDTCDHGADRGLDQVVRAHEPVEALPDGQHHEFVERTSVR